MGERLEEFKQKLEKINKILSNAGVKVRGWDADDEKDFEFSLDFSEHDKVFKDKIESLEKEIENFENETCETCYKEIKHDTEKCQNDALRHENDKLKLYIAELETRSKSKEPCLELPEAPIEVAKMLIDSIIEYETTPAQKAFGLGSKICRDRYDVNELEQIA